MEAYTLELPLETNLLAFTLYARTVIGIPRERPGDKTKETQMKDTNKSSYINVGEMLIDYGFVGTSEKLELLLADAKERSLTNDNWLPEVKHYEQLLKIQKRREADAATKTYLIRELGYTPTTKKESK